MAEEPDQEYVQCMTAKEIKKLAKPEFAANPDKFYPTGTLRKLGFSRAQCACGNNYWRHSEERKTCGDSNCEKKYTFIGKGSGRGQKGRKITYAEAWESFRRSFTTARVPCTPIKRYPVVARWRADVDYVAAGIFCFQPYCVTGELEPPANPLICPQFCLRFNDLDNIGLTGRHYSGFVMMGIQVFNKPNDQKFWADECIEFNYRWLTEELEINPDDITFVEDVWAGGGNLGPSIEYFIDGLELGNMVFMQFKTFPDGSREELDVKVIDVGIGLERVPWLVNGSPTSYVDVFPSALEFFLERTGMSINNDIWDKYGPYSCLLNVDEVEDLSKTWGWIAEQIGVSVEEVTTAIEPIRDMYIVLDHTRTAFMAIADGSLPSNVGGASNVRNILRRVFSTLEKNGWWEKFGMEGLLQLFSLHKTDLEELYGKFKEYKSFNPIIELEYNRWKFTDDAQNQKLKRLMKQRKNGLTIEDWIICVTAWGLPADTVAKITGQDIPGHLWYEIADRQERTVKALPAVLYSTAGLPATDSIYYKDHHIYDFDAKIVAVMANVQRNNEPSVVVLDESAFYPTSGGQEHDTGVLIVDGSEHKVVDVIKVGHCVLHIVDPPLPGGSTKDDLDKYTGKTVSAKIDVERRSQLRNNHTATHIVYASCRKVLGPHVWQHGAKKTVESAHLDITHYQSLSHEEVLAIENEANRIVHRCKDINKGFMPKDVAEKKYGFHLYQGGVVPGNELRVVSIADTDTEACCGTHCDNTAEVGTIKITKTSRISDGVLRLYYYAGENALSALNEDADILHNLIKDWGISKTEIVSTASRFFDGYKKRGDRASKQSLQILDLQMQCLVLDPEQKLIVRRSDEAAPTLFIGNMPPFAEKLKELNKGVVYVGDTFVYGLLGNESLFDAKGVLGPLIAEQLKKADAKKAAEAKEEEKKEEEKVEEKKGDKKKGKKKSADPIRVKNSVDVKGKGKGKKKGKKTKVAGVCEFNAFSITDPEEIVAALVNAGFKEL